MYAILFATALRSGLYDASRAAVGLSTTPPPAVKLLVTLYALLMVSVSIPGTPLLSGSDLRSVGQPIQVLLYAGKLMVLWRILYPSLTSIPEWLQYECRTWNRPLSGPDPLGERTMSPLRPFMRVGT
ncbi:MAG: hypothetical protein BWY96_02126 [Spirochaetes bacterium ADurb.BinA120]|nr:MAG: hypothetical protein BWY96_02126 [Spirochaetes bacterium ADurb.BinA120]